MQGWLCLILGLLVSPDGMAADNEVDQGRQIYMEGRLPSGAPLKGLRGGEEFTGRQAACVACHRPSGMGSVEGDIQIPPITGNYLYLTGDLTLATMDPRSGKRFNQSHDPYTDASVAHAVRHGINVGGEQMSALMPRYDLKQDEMRALIAYLKQLSRNYSPGATSDAIHFATVITPEADPEQRRMLLNVLNRGISQKNGSTVLGSQRGGRRHMVTAAEMVLGTERKWILHEWNLRGAPETWGAQLEKYYREQPVFAMLSGLSGSTWQPVHDFCEKSRVPCWFPSVDLPVESNADFYSVYFHKGVRLEARILAKYFDDEPQQAPRRLVQIYREDAVGSGGSAALAAALQHGAVQVENRPLTQFDAATLGRLLEDQGDGDAVMLWLDASDLHMLDSIPPPKSTIYLSGRLSGGESVALRPAWKQVARVIYPYELPDKRQANLFYFHQWARYNQTPIENEPLQSEAFFALEFMSETVTEMLDNLYRDYLLERAEYMLSRSESGKAEQRDRNRQVTRWSKKTPRAMPRQDTAMEHGAADQQAQSPEPYGKSTTIYPRMSLGVSQRFASKGGYVVRFESPDKNKLVPLTAWIIP